MKNVSLKTLVAVLAAVFVLPALGMADGHKMKKHMKMMDSNGDGKVSAQEYASAAAKRFGKIDADGDGFITKSEMKKAKKKHKKKDKKKKHKKDKDDDRKDKSKHDNDD